MKTRIVELLAFLAAIAIIAERSVDAAEPAASEAALRAAVAKSLPLLERGAKTSRIERSQCFTCHNNGLPIMAQTTARRKGFPIDEAELKTQLQFTVDFLAKDRDGYREGRGQPGKAFMAGYALWALNYGEWKPDETTAAVAEYFLKFQADDTHWSAHTSRPPSEASDFTANFLGLMSLKTFATSDQQDRVKARRDQVRGWLSSAEPKDTEDRVFRLLGLRLADSDRALVESAAAELLKLQQPDGGWSQNADLKSDVYATGTVLVALHQSGQLAVDSEPYRQGLELLLNSQLDDGSWHVVSRSEPFQEYYESGYPHAADQFISITAGGWATLAMLLALSDSATP